MELDELTIRIRVAAEEADAELAAFCERLSQIDEPSKAANAALAGVIGAAALLGQQAAAGAAGQSMLASAMGDAAYSMDRGAASASDYAGAVEQIERRAKRLASDTSVKRKMAQELSDMSRVIAAYKKGQASQESYNKVLKTLATRFGLVGLSADEAQAHIQSLGQTMADDMQAAQGEADGLLSKLYGVEAAAYITGSVSVDTASAHAALSSLSGEAQALLGILAALGVATGGGGGGGGGKRKSAYQREIEDLEHLIAVGKSDTQQTLAALRSMQLRYARLSKEDREDLEERLYEAVEALRKEDLQRDLDAIDHKKAMGELSYQQEIELLERVKAAHRLTADELMQIDERLYELGQDQLSHSADQIDALTQGVATALEARYQAMLDGELEALEQSREGWRRWSEETTGALEQQIAALDALGQAQDRQATDEKELRKIESLREQINFEQNDYNRAMLEKQLEQAITSRKERLMKQDIQDQKAALQAQMTDAQKRAEQEIALLDEQERAIQAQYDERMSAQAIAAESERLILSGQQEQLLSLLSQYASEYDAVGQTLGRRLAKGFTGSLSQIERWFDAFHSQLVTAQEQLDSLALEKADAFYQKHDPAKNAGSVNVNQTNVFNTPVETPAQTARRIRQANEELGALLG